MLYERWRHVAAAWPGGVALRDLAHGRVWTFKDLAVAAEQGEASDARVVFPTGTSAEFVLAVLKAWRRNQVVCPLEAGQHRPEFPDGVPPEIIHLKTTSATTGAPRLVAFTASQLAADADNIVATMGLQPDWPNLGVISLSHSYGFSNLVLPLLLHGIPLVLVGAALPEAVRQAASGAGGVTLAAVPALWRTWHEAGAIPRNVRLAISAGAPLPLPLEQGVFARHGLKIHNFYGSSECGGIAYDATAGPRLDAACAGTPLRNVEVRVLPDGCLEVRSAAVAAGYWPEPGSNPGNGAFRTSDLGEISQGMIFLRGRAGDQINVAGRKVSPEAIEKALGSHPQVRECLVFGVPSPEPERGESIVALVSTFGQPNLESLKHHVMGRVPIWQVPKEWWFVDALEANPRGKRPRAEWRKRYLEKAGRGSA
jgi:acyl-CoA synthetase (AMP-forming)/AMP-acid ligase II